MLSEDFYFTALEGFIAIVLFSWGFKRTSWSYSMWEGREGYTI